MIVVNARFLDQKITGVQRFAIEISKELDKLRDDVFFLCPKNSINRADLEILNAKEIGWFHGHLWEQIDLPFFLLKNKLPLLINLMSSSPLFYPQQISTIHDLAFIANPEWYSRRYALFYKWITRFVISNCKKLITVSHSSKDEIISNYTNAKSKIEVIYNAVSLKNNSYNISESESINDYYFLTLGSVSERKNITFLIQAFQKISAQHPNIYLYIIGNLDLGIFNKSSISKSISNTENKNIKILGYKSDDEIANLYRRAKLFIYPSLYEGFGIPPLEAQYFNCPVAVSHLPVFREVYEDSVLYFKLDNTDSLEKIMLDRIHEKLDIEDLIMRGHKNVEKYSWLKSATKLNELISKFV